MNSATAQCSAVLYSTDEAETPPDEAVPNTPLLTIWFGRRPAAASSPAGTGASVGKGLSSARGCMRLASSEWVPYTSQGVKTIGACSIADHDIL